MANPKLIATPFAETGARNDIPESGASEPQRATMQVGFPATTQTPISEGGIPPERADFNGAFHLTTSHLSFLNKGNWYGFDAAFAGQIGGYDKNAILMLDNGELVQSTQAGNTNNPNVNMTGWSKLKAKGSVDSISSLLLLTGVNNGDVIFVESYIQGLNKGGDNFKYNQTRSSENDSISVINGWERIPSRSYVSPFDGGAIGNYVADDKLAIERSQNYARARKTKLYIDGTFATSGCFVMIPQDYVEGIKLQSRIKKLGVLTSGLASRQAPEKPAGTIDNYDVDALVIFYPYDNNYADNIVLKDILFEAGTYGTSPASQFGFYAPRHSSCETQNLRFDNVILGFYSKNLFLNRHVNFSSVGKTESNIHESNTGMLIDDGTNVQTGTSNTFERFLFVNYKTAYQISNLQTSSFICCYGENIKSNGGYDDTQIFAFYNPYDINMTCCGLESSYGTPIYIVGSNPDQRSKISITGWQSKWGANGTLTDHGLNLLTILGSSDVVTTSSTFSKGAEGFINDNAFVLNGATLINSGSTIGTLPPQFAGGANVIDILNSLVEGSGGVVKSTRDVGNDLNNGVENKIGFVSKPVYGATLNIPSGVTDIYGTSVYYGLNASQGTHLLYSVGNQKSYKRFRTGADTYSSWLEF